MKKFIVLGLGNFGINVAKSLMENGCEVLGIDSDREIVESVKDQLTHAVIGDVTNRLVIESLSVKDFDGGIVTVGQDIATSILISLYLKETGLKRIIVRAISDDHVKILEKLGVSDIIFPERDVAIRIGKVLSMRNAFDYLPLTDEYAILEVKPPADFIGKTLIQLQIGAKYNCQVLGIKQVSNNGDVITKMAPSANDIIPEDCYMIVLGKHADIEKLQKHK